MKYFEQNGTVTEIIIQIIFLQFYVRKEIWCQREGLFKWFIRKSGPFAKCFLQQECLFDLLSCSFFFSWKYFQRTMWCYSMEQNAFVQYLGTEVDNCGLTWSKAFLNIAMNTFKIIYYFKPENGIKLPELSQQPRTHSPVYYFKKGRRTTFQRHLISMRDSPIFRLGCAKNLKFQTSRNELYWKLLCKLLCKVRRTRIFTKFKAFPICQWCQDMESLKVTETMLPTSVSYISSTLLENFSKQI